MVELDACSNDLDPRTLGQAPELATLTALGQLLHVTVRMLCAEHPTLLDDFPDSRCPEPATLREARKVLGRIELLGQALNRYRRAALDALAPVTAATCDDLPF